VKQGSKHGQKIYGATFGTPVDFGVTGLKEQIHLRNFQLSGHRDYKDTYYDTTNLDLSRFGALLRLRISAERTFWNVQLFRKKNDRYLILHDLEFEGSPSEIPEEPINLLYAFHRSQQLVQIGQIRIIQTNYERQDGEGPPHDGIIDRDISSSGTISGAQHFRDIILRTSSRATFDRAPYESLEAFMLSKGGDKYLDIPEIFRVLGPIAPSLHTILESSGDPDSRAYAILQQAVALAVGRLLRFDPGVRLSPDPEIVHEFRVTVRRLRSDLRSFSSIIDAAGANLLRNELAWLGGEVGKIRDCDVLTEHIHDLSLHNLSEDQAGIVMLQDFINSLCKINRKLLLETISSKRYADLIETIINIAIGSISIENAAGINQHKPFQKSSERIIKKIVRQRWRKYARAAQQINTGSSERELHHVRILAKRCRYAAEAALPLFGVAARRFSRSMQEVQNLLGTYHDCAFQETWLRKIAEDLPDARVAIGELTFLIQQEREYLKSKWPKIWKKTSSPKLRRWTDA